jgi:hypothetical protein
LMGICRIPTGYQRKRNLISHTLRTKESPWKSKALLKHTTHPQLPPGGESIISIKSQLWDFYPTQKVKPLTGDGLANFRVEL